MIKLSKTSAIFISVTISIVVACLLYHIFDIFNLDTIIMLDNPISNSNRFYDNETSSLLAFLGYWHGIIVFLSGYVTYNLISSSKKFDNTKILFALYLFTSSTFILIPAHFIESWLDSTINSNRIFNFFDFLLSISVIFSFYLFWRSFQNRRSKIAGFKLWILLVESDNFQRKYIVEARSEEEAKNCIDEFYYSNEKIQSLMPFHGQLKVFKFRKSKPNVIDTLYSS